MEGIYEFGPFRLETGERRLLRDGRPIRLRGKVFDTLCVLVSRPGRLVEKDDLISAVWPDTVVEENNLAHNINALRFGRRRSDRDSSGERLPFCRSRLQGRCGPHHARWRPAGRTPSSNANSR